MRAPFVVLAAVALLSVTRASLQQQRHPNIEHVVVLMLENRSFDHMLGWLGKASPAHAGVNGLTGKEYNLVNCSDPNSQKVMISEHADYEPADLGHEVSDITEQLTCDRLSDFSKTYTKAQFKMNGFVTNTHHTHVPVPNQQQPMQAFPEKEVPVMYSLAKLGGVADQYFCSVPGNTQNNRLFFHCGSVSGLCVNFDKNKVLAGLPDQTMYNKLEDAGVSWRVYQHDLSSIIYFKSMRRWKTFSNFRFFNSFKSDAKEGKLPSFSFIEPRYFDVLLWKANDQHPSHPVPYGEQLIKEVYESLRASPKWEKTALIITYDEHGGFYDHVAPAASAPDPEAGHGRGPCSGESAPNKFKFNRGGLRVPFVVVSPWVKKGMLKGFTKPNTESVLEHTSMWPTLRKLFGIRETGTDLSNRTPWAATFENIFETDPKAKRAAAEFPMTLPKPVDPHPNKNNIMNGLQKELLAAASVLSGRPPPETSDEEKAGGLVEKAMGVIRGLLEKYDSLNQMVIDTKNKIKDAGTGVVNNVKTDLNKLWTATKDKAASVRSWVSKPAAKPKPTPQGDLGSDLRFESTMTEAELKALANSPFRAANGELIGPDADHPLFDADYYYNSEPYFMPGILSELADQHGIPEEAFHVFNDV